MNLNNENVIDEEIKDLALTHENTSYYHLIAKKKPNVKRAVQMWLSGKYKLVEIADETGWHYETVRQWLVRDKDVVEYMRLYQEEEMQLVKNKLQSATTNALDRMIQLCDSSCDAIAIQAARDILDRSGLKPVQKVQKEINVTSYEEKIKSIIDNVDVIDADYEAVDE